MRSVAVVIVFCLCSSYPAASQGDEAYLSALSNLEFAIETQNELFSQSVEREQLISYNEDLIPGSSVSLIRVLNAEAASQIEALRQTQDSLVERTELLRAIEADVRKCGEAFASGNNRSAKRMCFIYDRFFRATPELSSLSKDELSALVEDVRTAELTEPFVSSSISEGESDLLHNRPTSPGPPSETRYNPGVSPGSVQVPIFGEELVGTVIQPEPANPQRPTLKGWDPKDIFAR